MRDEPEGELQKRQQQQKEIADKLNDFAEYLLTHSILPDGLPEDVFQRCSLALGRCADSIRGIAKDL